VVDGENGDNDMIFSYAALSGL